MILTLALAVSLAQQAAAAPPPAADYVPQRVFDTRRGAFVDFESMVAVLTKADVVLVGEQHDDPTRTDSNMPSFRGSNGDGSRPRCRSRCSNATSRRCSTAT